MTGREEGEKEKESESEKGYNFFFFLNMLRGKGRLHKYPIDREKITQAVRVIRHSHGNIHTYNKYHVDGIIYTHSKYYKARETHMLIVEIGMNVWVI